MNETELMEMTEKTERRLARLLKEYPCFYYISPIERTRSRMKEICCNEKYLNEIGYSVESFATTVLQEGVPR